MTRLFSSTRSHFSGKFVVSLLNTVVTLKQDTVSSLPMNTPVLWHFRGWKHWSRCFKGCQSTPFDGKLEYDVWLTIDSDIIFTPEQVIELIEDTKTYPVVSGLYRMEDLKHFAMVKNWDVETFKERGTFDFATVDSIANEPKYMSVRITVSAFSRVVKVSSKSWSIHTLATLS